MVDVRTEQQARLIWDVRNPKFVPATIIPALGELYLASMTLLLVLFPIPIGTMALITGFSKCKYAETTRRDLGNENPPTQP